jgi:hypothetical protein
MRYIFAVLIIFSFFFSSWGQIKLAPLSHNASLLKSTSVHTQASSHYADILQLNVQTLQSDSLCVDSNLLSEPFARLEFDPVGIIGGDLEVNENCLTFTAGFIQVPVVDSIDLFLIDEEENVVTLLLIVKTLPPLQLPVIDNFSAVGPYPNQGFWLDREAYINRNLAHEPLSLGAATLDGVNENGIPYGGGTGISDHLTSVFLDIEGLDFPVLQYFYQARGRGFAGFPREQDSLILEFKTQEGTWEQIKAYPGLGDEGVQPFQYEEISILPKYRYEGFQFRFKNISRRDGILGAWHLDYVIVSDEPVPTSNIADVSLLSEPTGVLAPYRAMPATQFMNWVSTRTASEITIKISNNFPNTQEVSNSRLLVNEIPGSIPLIEETLLEVPPVVPENQRTLSPGQFTFQNPIKRRDGLINALEFLNVMDGDSAQVEMVYEIEPENEETRPAFSANNRVSSTTDLIDYYAYDDGSAEVGIFVQGTGQFDLVAQEYEAIAGDTLKAIRIMFPFVFTEGERQRFELLVWTDSLPSAPVYSFFYDQPIFASQHGEGIGSFTNYALKTELGQDTSIYIPPGKFYIGWRQVSSSSPFGLYIGFDRDSPQATSHIFFNTTGSWNQVTPGGDVEGAIMIRPVFGAERQVTTQVQSPPGSLHKISLSPNPTSDALLITSKAFDVMQSVIEVYNISGQKVMQTSDRNKINVSGLVSGYYIILLKDTEGHIEASQSFIKT